WGVARLDFDALMNLVADVRHLAAEAENASVWTRRGGGGCAGRVRDIHRFDGITKVAAEHFELHGRPQRQRLREADVPVAAVLRLKIRIRQRLSKARRVDVFQHRKSATVRERHEEVASGSYL